MGRMRALITGGDGVLASYFSSGTRVGRAAMDITDAESVARVCAQYAPKVIIHCAALTDLALCERESDKAYLVNAAGTLNVALAARAIGAALVYVSTSDVFDGTKMEPYTESDIPNPVSVYGRSKYLGELAARAVLPNDSLIVRVSWMFGGGPGRDNRFVGKVLAQAGARELRAVADKKGSPSYAKDVAKEIERLINEKRRGICHISGGMATRYDMAKEIAEVAEWDSTVAPTDSSAFPLAYPIGANTSMNSSSPIRPWQEALREYMKTEWGIPARASK